MKKNTTIKDIAKLAGVSIGTVDRVLHNRGRVSKKALEKVNQALKELEYTPNPIARSLRNNVVYTVQILIPDPKKDPYWLPCMQGVTELIEEFAAFHLNFAVHTFDPSKPQSFSNMGNKLLELGPDAIMFVPLFGKESTQLQKQLFKRDIVSITFNSPIKDHFHHHVGQDLFLSGRVGAKLVSGLVKAPSQLAIIHVEEAYNNAAHMQEKENGFRSYFQEEETGYDIKTLTLKTKEIREQFDKVVQTHPEIEAYFVTTSKTYEVANALTQLGIRKAVIGYDLIPNNVSCLQKNQIQFLIHQAPKKQAYLGLRSLVEKLLFNKELAKVELLPIDIINSENVKSYL
ncbi:LacI family DNA-binding transcriptional regulator [Flagellimonas myxillae]|uniref:LacI family DNA-binding transcriptional regulator n=1 Tax=Flagellimonas myxillae TaxID=2942214 RepID=UPI00201F2623|nr:LacI family DNA-binding transcriptional regulator [Muricauda myxillae]MCL6265455.1 LacI family DNA-binding transcriptional regulator [Muricauda myxillae]